MPHKDKVHKTCIHTLLLFTICLTIIDILYDYTCSRSSIKCYDWSAKQSVQV